MSRRTLLSCQRCGTKYPVSRYRVAISKFCSRQCANKAHAKPLCKRGHDKAVAGLTKDRWCRQCSRESGKMFRRRNKENDRAKRYGLSVEELRRLGNTCAICGEPAKVIDHDRSCCPGIYACGKCTRLPLCYRCNTGLGQFKDDPILLRSAHDYIVGWRNGTLGRKNT